MYLKVRELGDDTQMLLGDIILIYLAIQRDKLTLILDQEALESFEELSMS